LGAVRAARPGDTKFGIARVDCAFVDLIFEGQAEPENLFWPRGESVELYLYP
jgi:hypothetical protein